VVVSHVLVPISLVLLWPGLQRMPRWAFLPTLSCHLTRSVCLALQPTVPDRACYRTRVAAGSIPLFHSDSRSSLLSHRECDQAGRSEPLGILCLLGCQDWLAFSYLFPERVHRHHI
jgi:hypothetical protein